MPAGSSTPSSASITTRATASTPDFHRGEHRYDRYLGDGDAPHPNLAPLVAAPFAAAGSDCGAFGTRGGVRTDEFGRALTPFSEPIPRLFAVGNNAAHPIPFGYMGAGSTLGPGMTMAYAAGQTILQRRGLSGSETQAAADDLLHDLGRPAVDGGDRASTYARAIGNSTMYP